MDVARPYKAVCPSLDGEVLNVLAGTTRGLTGREVALLTGRTSHSGILAVLNRLTEQGLVDRVELNRAFLFSMNREHLAYPAVIALVGMRVALFGKIQDELNAWGLAPVHVSLFGSTARGDGDTQSDIDLFVVRPAEIDQEDARWREQLDELEDRVSRWTGNRAAVLEISESEIERLVAEDRPIVSELRADAIVLAGSTIPALLGET
ncbi:MAG TPA: nucleotidyltransferase domain-containing protein [Solirubrobacteraceae bacterium]|jgi:predicted nucleotidyltransferase|nr:nucleotidyltransferase domain-containing protein [Solirubrobacteraceae bacterium]